MHDFGPFAYLDLHKTGSSYISKFLSECSTCDEIYFKKHHWVTDNFHADKFYFISIRRPIDMYSSLYRFGKDGKGSVFNQLKRSCNLNAYDSFESFLTFFLDSKNADFLGYGYRQDIAKEMGFMSFRFLKLSLHYPMQKINQTLQSGEKLRGLEQRFITKLEIKNEELNHGLRVLSENILPQYFNQVSVDKFLLTSPKINASKRPPESIDLNISNKIIGLLEEKESLLFSRY